MTSLFDPLLAVLGLRCVVGLNEYYHESDVGGSRSASRSPHDIFFSAVPEVDYCPSPSINRQGQPEFVVVNGRQVVNNLFWKRQMQFYNRPDMSVLKVMSVTAFMPSWMYHESQVNDHTEACAWFNEHNCGLGNDFFLLSMFNQVASAYLLFMQSRLVQMARMLGFRPLFLMRNTLLQHSKFGVRGYHFSSCDKGARSCLLLVGFWRMPGNDPQNLQVVAVQANGSYLKHHAA
jgi:hypothetical protein